MIRFILACLCLALAAFAAEAGHVLPFAERDAKDATAMSVHRAPEPELWRGDSLKIQLRQQILLHRLKQERKSTAL